MNIIYDSGTHLMRIVLVMTFLCSVYISALNTRSS